MPLNARHCAEYPQLAKSSLWARSVHCTMESWNRAGEGKDRERGPQTISKCTLVQCVVTEPKSVSPWVREEDCFLSPGRVGMSGEGADLCCEQKKRTQLTWKK